MTQIPFLLSTLRVYSHYHKLHAQALVLFTGSLVTAMPILAMVHVAVGLTWISATLALAKIMKVRYWLL